MKYYLMNKNTEVARIEYDTNIDTITKIYDLLNIDYAPLSIQNTMNNHNTNKITEWNTWFKKRGIPTWRKSLPNLLIHLGVSSTDELLNKAYALSLSDQYWLKDENSDIHWSAINFFENDFEYQDYLDVALKDSSTHHPDLKSPNNTTDGMLPKAWIIENNKRVLVKGTYTTSQQEPSNEWLASQICKRLGFDYCPYTLDLIDHQIVSKCENFISKNEEILSAYDIYCSEKKENNINDFTHYVNILNAHHVPHAKESLENMFIVDYIMMNIDRHMKNYGVIRNVKTLQWERLTPIFDTGQAMNCSELTELLNFHNGHGKFFKNTRKRFSDYIVNFSGLQRIDFSLLTGLDQEYRSILLQYKDAMNLSNERIDALVNGLTMRISMLRQDTLKSQ